MKCKGRMWEVREKREKGTEVRTIGWERLLPSVFWTWEEHWLTNSQQFPLPAQRSSHPHSSMEREGTLEKRRGGGKEGTDRKRRKWNGREIPGRVLGLIWSEVQMILSGLRFFLFLLFVFALHCLYSQCRAVAWAAVPTKKRGPFAIPSSIPSYLPYIRMSTPD